MWGGGEVRVGGGRVRGVGGCRGGRGGIRVAPTHPSTAAAQCLPVLVIPPSLPFPSPLPASPPLLCPDPAILPPTCAIPAFPLPPPHPLPPVPAPGAVLKSAKGNSIDPGARGPHECPTVNSSEVVYDPLTGLPNEGMFAELDLWYKNLYDINRAFVFPHHNNTVLGSDSNNIHGVAGSSYFWAYGSPSLQSLAVTLEMMITGVYM